MDQGNIYLTQRMYCIVTHRRLRLPKVPQFRDWFGVSWLQCTFKHIPHSTFRVLNLGIGLGFHVGAAPVKTKLRSFNLGIGYSSTPVTTEPGQTKEPGRIVTYMKTIKIQPVYVNKYYSRMDPMGNVPLFFSQLVGRFGAGYSRHLFLVAGGY